MKLEAQQLAFGYPERVVGRDVSMSLSPGEVVCLLGPNGCGKTTLFKTMLGLLVPRGGRVSLDAQDIAGMSRPEIARLLAYVPQAQAAPFPYSVIEVVLMGRTAHKGLFAGPSREDREIALAALEELQVAGLAERDFTQLSGGQRQLVVIARAIAQASPLVIMDEPTASLDFGNQVVVLTEVRRRVARGVGIVLSTHDPDHAFAVADRVALMRDGAIVASGAPAAVLTANSLRAVYGVDVSIERIGSGQTVCAPRYNR